jgi:hypothetical protein
MYGPNTNLGHNSIIFMIECQTEYILQAIRTLVDRDLAWLDLRGEVMEQYNAALQRRLGGSVWATVDKSWYKNEAGVITNNWAGSTIQYWWRTRRFDPSLYELRARSALASAAAAAADGKAAAA